MDVENLQRMFPLANEKQLTFENLYTLILGLPICAVWVDETGQVRFASDACQRVLGDDIEDALRQCADMPANEGRCLWHDEAAFDNEEPHYALLTLHTTRGELTLAHVCRAHYDEEGVFRGRVGVFANANVCGVLLDDGIVGRFQNKALYASLEALNAARSLEEVYEVAVDSILDVLNADKASLLLFGRDGKPHFVAWRHLSETYRQRVDGHSPWKQEEVDAAPIWFPDVRTAPLSDELKAWLAEEGIAALGFIPLPGNEVLLGKFMVYYKHPHAWSSIERRWARALADNLATAILRLRAERALRASEEHYRDLVENLRDVIGVHDFEGRLLTVNAVGRRALGLPLEGKLPDVSMTTLLAPEVRDEFPNYLKRLQETGHDEGLVKIQVPGQEPRLWEYSSSLRMDEAHPVVRFSARDVTERYQATKALKESEARFRAMAESSFAGVFAVVNERLVYVNESLAALVGYTPEELIGKRVIEILHPDEREAVIARGRARRAGKKVPTQYETRLLYRDGSTRWVRLGVEKATWEDQPALIGSAVDITEHKRYELMLEAEVKIARAAGLISDESMEETLNHVLATVVDVFPAVARAGVFLLEESGHACLKAQRGYDALLKGRRCFLCCRRLLSRETSWEPFVTTDLTDLLEHFDRTGYRPGQTALVVPLAFREHLMGILVLESGGAVGAFNEQDIALFRHFATTVSLLLQDARLLDDLQQRLHELEAVSQVTWTLRLATNVRETVEGLLQESLNAVGSSAGGIMLYHPDKNVLRFEATRGWFDGWADYATKPGEGIGGRVFSSGEPYFSREFRYDILASEDEREHMPDGWGGVCLPLRTAHEVLGVMFVAVPTQTPLNHQKRRILRTVADIGSGSLQRLRLYEMTQEHLRWLQMLQATAQAVSSSLDLRLTLDVLLEQVRGHFQVDAACVLLLDKSRTLMTLAAEKGVRHLGRDDYLPVPLGATLAGRAVMRQRPVIVPDLSQATLPLKFAAFVKEEGFVTYIGIPLIAKGTVRGVLEICHRSTLPPLRREAMEFLEVLGRYAAVAIDNARMFQNLQRTTYELRAAYDLTIEGWARALDLRDHETEGHTQRVTDLTLQLARALEVPEEELVHLRRGALLHDIGKIGVPDNILRKPGPLTPEEWEIMRQHPVLAYRMLSGIDYLRPALAIPLFHHERWDGSGYPQGLKGEDIPKAARIFAVVDVYDALTSDRPYRKAWPREKALAYIRENSGKLFDPAVVNAFLKLMASRK